MKQFEHKVALVTGAGSGMGRDTAIVLAERGAAVTLVGRREEKLAEVAAEITTAGGRVMSVAGDVSKPEDIERAVARTIEAFGGLHYAVNNACVSGCFDPLPEMSVESWNRTISIDLSSLFYGLKYEIPAILAAGGAQSSTSPACSPIVVVLLPIILPPSMASGASPGRRRYSMDGRAYG